MTNQREKLDKFIQQHNIRSFEELTVIRNRESEMKAMRLSLALFGYPVPPENISFQKWRQFIPGRDKERHVPKKKWIIVLP